MFSVTQEPASVGRPSRGKTILIVENDPANGEFLVEAITLETPHHVLLAPDSRRALEMVEHIHPDLFLLDYGITPLNGLDLYDQLHAHPGLEAIPAIILSASAEQHALEIAARKLIGLSKPVDLDELIQTIETVLTHPLAAEPETATN